MLQHRYILATILLGPMAAVLEYIYKGCGQSLSELVGVVIRHLLQLQGLFLLVYCSYSSLPRPCDSTLPV